MSAKIDLIKKLVQERLSEPVPCFHHCNEESELRFVLHGKEGGNGLPLLACNSCPSGYVSRIIAYGYDVDLNKFKAFIAGLLQGSGSTVEDEDIRVATRYRWDLGNFENDTERVMREAYWTQNYRRSKSEDPDRTALFLCSKCNSSLFLQSIRGTESLCASCCVKNLTEA